MHIQRLRLSSSALPAMLRDLLDHVHTVQTRVEMKAKKTKLALDAGTNHATSRNSIESFILHTDVNAHQPAAALKASVGVRGRW